jgi:hypothetical protein
MFFAALTDAEFADWSTISETDYPDARMAVMIYEPILKQVLEDIQPDFACAYADLGQPRKIDQEFGGWDYLFELPADFLCLVKQLAEGDQSKEESAQPGYRCEVLHFKGYSHTVVGSDGLVYYCDTDHTSVDDTTDGQPPDGDGDGNWTLDATEELEGAAWAAGVAYEYDSTGLMLASNDLTNEDGTAAYIKYVAYVQTTSGGTAGRSDQPQYYPESFKNALATRLAAEMTLDAKDYERRRMLLDEYERLAKSAYWHVQNRHKDRVRKTTVFEARTKSS